MKYLFMQYIFIYLICISLGFGEMSSHEERDDKHFTYRYFKSFSLFKLDYQPIFYREINITDLKGEWYKSYSVSAGMKLKLQVLYKPTRTIPHVEVAYNELNLPVVIKVFKKGAKLNRVLRIHYDDERRPIWIKEERQFENGSVSKIDSEIKYNQKRLFLVRHWNGAKQFEWSDHYYYLDNEIKQLSVFPKGRLKKVRIYQMIDKKKLVYREKEMSFKNVSFDVGEEKKSPMLNVLDQFPELMKMSYSILTDYDLEVGVIGYGERKMVKTIKNAKKEHFVQHYEYNVLMNEVKLLKEFNGTKMNPTYELYFHQNQYYDNYSVKVFDLINRQIKEKRVYEDGLLTSKSILFESPAKKIEKKIQYAYFPNRSLFNQSIYINGIFVEQNQFSF